MQPHRTATHFETQLAFLTSVEAKPLKLDQLWQRFGVSGTKGSALQRMLQAWHTANGAAISRALQLPVLINMYLEYFVLLVAAPSILSTFPDNARLHEALADALAVPRWLVAELERLPQTIAMSSTVQMMTACQQCAADMAQMLQTHGEREPGKDAARVYISEADAMLATRILRTQLVTQIAHAAQSMFEELPQTAAVKAFLPFKADALRMFCETAQVLAAEKQRAEQWEQELSRDSFMNMLGQSVFKTFAPQVASLQATMRFGMDLCTKPSSA